MEIWKDIKGYEDLYEVSNLGRVRNKVRGNILYVKINHNGYCVVKLNKDAKRKDFFVHRLVAIAFIPNPENKRTVNHKDEVKTNNHVDNLEWMTTAENNSYGTRTERAISVFKKRVRCITTGLEYDSVTEAAKSVGLKSRSEISMCCKGTAKHAGKLPDGTKLEWEYIE